MAIKRRNGLWQADITIAGQRVRRSFGSKQQAREFEATETITGGHGRVRPRSLSEPQKLFKEAIQATYDRVWAGQKSSETALKNAELALRLIGNLPLKRITSAVIDDFVSELEKRGAAPATVNRKLAALSKVLHFSKTRGWLTEIPSMERKREPEGRLRFFTEQEEADLIHAFKARGWESMADLVAVLADSGLRLGEALKLRKVDVADGMILVADAKSLSGTRGVPQTARVRLIFTDRIVNLPAGTDRIFHDLHKRSVTYYWDQLREDLGRKDEAEWVPHTLRHTFISRLVQRGVPLRVVQELAGHSSIMMTQRYAHLSAQNYQSAMRTLEPSGAPENPISSPCSNLQG